MSQEDVACTQEIAKFIKQSMKLGDNNSIYYPLGLCLLGDRLLV